MSNPVFEGAAVAIITPFFEDGGINFEELGKMIEFEIENKIDSIVICGSTGEAATMDHEEHVEAIKYAVEKVAGRVPVIAGTGSNDTNYCVTLSKKAEELGADALLLVTPYYNKCTQEGLYQHYKKVATAVSCPIILYNVPSRTNVNISPALLKRLAEFDNIVGIKECNFSQVPDIFNLCGDRFAVYSGEDALAVPMVSLGGKGVISVVANILPEITGKMMHDALDGNYDTARAAQIELVPLINSLFCEVNPIPVKEAMNILGWNAGPCRLPLCDMSEAGHKRMVDTLAQYDVSAMDKYVK